MKAGDKVKVGQAILSVEDGAPQRRASRPAGAVEGRTPGRVAELEQPDRPRSRRECRGRPRAPDETPEPRARSGRGEPRQTSPGRRDAPARAGTRPQLDKPASERDNVVDISRGARPAAEPAAAPEQPPAPAAPSVRRMARELGVDINEVAGSGAGRPHFGRGRQGAREAAA